MLIHLAIAAVCLMYPVEGPVTNGFAPVGDYAGHWGLDQNVPLGTLIRAPVSGRVSFAGTVAGMATVTIEPVAGLKVSVSYLSRIDVRIGDRVTRGQVIGRAGVPHGTPGTHLSVRFDGRYVDPGGWIGCRQTDITRALRLVTPPGPYPRRRAHRHFGRDIRPDPHRTSSCRGDRPPSSEVGPGALHAGRGPMAEG